MVQKGRTCHRPLVHANLTTATGMYGAAWGPSQPPPAPVALPSAPLPGPPDVSKKVEQSTIEVEDEDGDAAWLARRQAIAQGKRPASAPDPVTVAPAPPPALVARVVVGGARTPEPDPDVVVAAAGLAHLSEEAQLAAAVALSLQDAHSAPVEPVAAPPAPAIHAPTAPVLAPPPPTVADDAELRRFLQALDAPEATLGTTQAALARERTQLQQQQRRDQRDASTVTAEMVTETQVGVLLGTASLAWPVC